ncbi:hypothetical protein S144_1 [Shewanella sp. phage 1/44]|nr:hypothetical protein S144_1 [Shewanella sp. phage 1/44]AHK11716.1 hypothetical protein S144_1 [Shewanella sp. phage 1/44]
MPLYCYNVAQPGTHFSNCMIVNVLQCATFFIKPGTDV